MRAFIAMAHVASQLTYRTVPGITESDLRVPDPLVDAFGTGFESWSLAEWQSFMAACLEADVPLLGWLKVYAKTYDPQGKKLVVSLYEHLQACFAAGGHYLVWGDRHYPPMLSFLNDPPLGLSLLGALPALQEPTVSVIGARKANSFALEQSRKMGQRLAEFQIMTVSGGAYGCDISVHRGVLDHADEKARAMIVFAGGLGKLYPVGNQKVFNALRARQALFISEKLWQQTAIPADFPHRNRIISGLSGELLVMQAGLKSGACTTAHRALEQGREVLVLRHALDDPNCLGSAALIADGAYSFGEVDELLAHYAFCHERQAGRVGYGYLA